MKLSRGKRLRSLRFTAMHRSSLCKIGCGIFWRHQRAIHENPICESFLLRKFSTICYTHIFTRLYGCKKRRYLRDDTVLIPTAWIMPAMWLLFVYEIVVPNIPAAVDEMRPGILADTCLGCALGWHLEQPYTFYTANAQTFTSTF